MVGACERNCRSHALPMVYSFSGLIMPDELSPSFGSELSAADVMLENRTNNSRGIHAIEVVLCSIAVSVIMSIVEYIHLTCLVIMVVLFNALITG